MINLPDFLYSEEEKTEKDNAGRVWGWLGHRVGGRECGWRGIICEKKEVVVVRDCRWKKRRGGAFDLEFRAGGDGDGAAHSNANPPCIPTRLFWEAPVAWLSHGDVKNGEKKTEQSACVVFVNKCYCVDSGCAFWGGLGGRMCLCLHRCVYSAMKRLLYRLLWSVSLHHRRLSCVSITYEQKESHWISRWVFFLHFLFLCLHPPTPL